MQYLDADGLKTNDYRFFSSYTDMTAKSTIQYQDLRRAILTQPLAKVTQAKRKVPSKNIENCALENFLKFRISKIIFFTPTGIPRKRKTVKKF